MPGLISSNIAYDQAFYEQPFIDFLTTQNVSHITQNNYISDLRHFFHWFDPHNFQMITPDSIEQYKQSQQTSLVPIASINRRLSTLRKFFSFATGEGWIPENPMKRIKNITKFISAPPSVEVQQKEQNEINTIKSHRFSTPMAIGFMALLGFIGSGALVFQITSIRNQTPTKTISPPASAQVNKVITTNDVLGETIIATPTPLPLPMPPEATLDATLSAIPLATSDATLSNTSFFTMIFNSLQLQQQMITSLFSATKTIVANSITIGGQSLTDYIHSNMNNTTLVSPLAQVGEIDTNVISPLAANSPGIAVKLGPTQTFGIYDQSNTPVAKFDTQGNATFSGTLYADRIITKQGDFDSINTASIAANFITNITNIINNTATPAAGIPTPMPLPPSLTATTSALLSDVIITSSLGVDGPAEMTSATLTNDLTVHGTIATNIISPLADDINVNLKTSFGQLLISGANNVPVIAFDGMGNATFSGELTASKLSFAEASPSAQVIGVATISANLTQVTVPTTQVTPNSYIYITPTTNPDNHILYVLDKNPGISFTVGLSTSYTSDIDFNWLIIN